MEALSFQRIREVAARTGLSRSTIYAKVAAGTFPRPVPLGSANIIGFVSSEVSEWCEAQIRAARPDLAAA